jgi:nicotinate-nucleotide pyrophosphorylase
MNIVKLIFKVRAYFKAGKAVPNSHVVVNTASGATAIYTVLSVVVLLLNSCGVATDTLTPENLHTAADTLEVVAYGSFAVWNQVTNKEAGFQNG